jgi:hypothetical protein
MLFKDRQIARKGWKISETCPKHEDIPGNDACPCFGAIWYDEDRVEEGIKRLNEGDALLGWFWWYLRSSSELTAERDHYLLIFDVAKNPCFPKQSVDIFQQDAASLEAWERYQIGQRQKGGRDDMRIVYYENGRIRSARQRTNRSFVASQ